MKSFAIVNIVSIALVSLATSVAAVPPFDPAGGPNVGNGAGRQFITGQCLSDADCGSGCCAKPTGICSGPGAAFQQGKEGCGFTAAGGAAPAPAAPAPAPPAGGAPGALAAPANGGPPFDPNGAKNVGNGAGAQFITGQCLSNADCGSGCCAFPSGICSGPGAAFQNGKQGCGFGGAAAPAPAPAAAAPAPAAPAAAAPANGGPPFDPAGGKNVGNGAGGQFIGGQCLSNADCGSGCCALPSGICSGPGAAFQNGKQGCGFGGAGAPAPAPAAPAAPAVAAGGPPFDPAGAKNVGNGNGGQFIGGQCLSGADCGSGCCAGPAGICSGVGAQTQNGKTGCGFLQRRFIRRAPWAVLPL